MDWSAVCSKCGEAVSFGAFGPCKKKPGNHVVPAKTYYHPGARDLQDIKSRRFFAPQVVLVPSYDQLDSRTNTTVKTVGVMVQFHDGKLATDDPEKQYYLDQRDGDILSGDAGLKMWQAIYLTPQQQIAIAEAELADVQRKVVEENALLAAAKAKTQSPAKAHASV